MFVDALVLVAAVCSTLVAVYQWSVFAARSWKIRILSTALAVMLWLVWFYATIHASRSPQKIIQTEAATPLFRLAAQRGGEIMPDGDTTISALYKVFEQAVRSYLAIPSAEDKEKFERGLDEAAAIAERIVRLPAADINDMLVKIRMVAWDRGERFTSLAELDLWEPEDEGLEFDALVSLRDDLRQLCLLEKAHREALRKSFPDGAALALPLDRLERAPRPWPAAKRDDLRRLRALERSFLARLHQSTRPDRR
jgi:hypothetical protein